MIAKVDTNIFRSNSQLMNIDPGRIKPCFDRLLLREIKDPKKIGSIFIPETAAERGVGKNGLARLGVVVAVGPGDPWAKEKVIKGTTEVVRKALGACLECKNSPNPGFLRWRVSGGPDGPHGEWSDWEKCYGCAGDGIRRWPMYCRVGDVVIYDVRKEAQIFINGETFTLLHEEQSILGIIES